MRRLHSLRSALSNGIALKGQNTIGAALGVLITHSQGCALGYHIAPFQGDPNTPHALRDVKRCVHLYRLAPGDKLLKTGRLSR